MKEIAEKFLKTDIYNKIFDWWNNIDEVYKKSFFIIFVLANIIFAYYTINFMWGNHEWPYIVDNVALNYSFYEARITEKIEFILFNHQFLPIVFSLFQLLGMSLGAVLLAIYWKIPKTVHNYSLFGLFIISIPFNLCSLFHPCFYDWNLPCIVGSYLLYEKARESRFKLLWNILIIVLLFHAVNVYPASINMVFVVLLCRMLIDYLNENRLKQLFIKYRLLLFDILCSALLQKLGLFILSSKNILLDDFYNIQMISIDSLISKLIEVIPYTINQFGRTYPFITGLYHKELLFISILALIILLTVFSKKGLKYFNAVIIGTALILYATQIAMIISPNQLGLQYLARIVRCGLMYVYVFSAAILLIHGQSKIWLKNIVLTVLIVTIWGGAINEIHAQKVNKMGYDAEMRTWDRIFQNIESSGKIDYNKDYAMIVLGELPLRSKYYTNSYNTSDVTMLNWSFEACWLFKYFFRTRYPQLKTGYVYNTRYIQNDSLERFPELENWLINEAKPYPMTPSIYIKDNIIAICLTQAGIDDAVNKITENRKKNKK